MAMKRCTRCPSEVALKDESQFYTRKARGKIYLRDECKQCCKKIAAQYRDTANANRKARRAADPTIRTREYTNAKERVALHRAERAKQRASDLLPIALAVQAANQAATAKDTVTGATLWQDVAGGLRAIWWLALIERRKTRKPKYTPFKKLELKIRAARGLCSRRNCPEQAISQRLCPGHLKEKSQGEIRSRKKEKKK